MEIFSIWSHVVGEGAVKGGFEVFDSAVHVAVHGFHFAATVCCLVEHLVEGVEVFGEDADVEFAKTFGTEAEFATFKGPGLGEAEIFEMVEVSLDCPGEFEVLSPVNQIDPNRVDVHCF